MKLRGVSFSNHPVLGDLDLDFCIDGRPASSIYIAGENGTGKTVLLNSLYSLTDLKPAKVEDGVSIKYDIELSPDEIGILKSHDDVGAAEESCIDKEISVLVSGEGEKTWNRLTLQVVVDGKSRDIRGAVLNDVRIKNLFKLLFSDVGINFTPEKITSVTAKNVDEITTSQKTSTNLATEMTQLMVDIQALDDADFSKWGRDNIGKPIDDSALDRRISRFQDAFSIMFPSKGYKEIRNVSGNKKVVFSDQGKECFIEDLSSGEKQIVFRGGFFLKDSGASEGAVALLDEPEISLHPNWQLKIMSFYKAVMGIRGKNSESQLIVATHSPFIIHNYNNEEEVIIVLGKASNGEVKVLENPRFYGWTHQEAVREAFKININHGTTAPLVLVEGETDEKYLNEAAETLGCDLRGAEIQWVGRVGDGGSSEFSGDTALRNR